MLPAIRDVGSGFRRRLYADSLALQVRLAAAPGVSTFHIATVGSTPPGPGDDLPDSCGNCVARMTSGATCHC